MRIPLQRGLTVLLILAAVMTHAADSLVWDAKQNSISAEVASWPLSTLLEKITAATGWQVYVEPDSAHAASAKFKNLPLSGGLRALLGDLSFALVPQTNAPSKLYVFHTSLASATKLISLVKVGKKTPGAKAIPNQLVVTVKPGVNIDELARRLGAKVIGRVAGMNTYLLEFPDEASAQAALATLSANPDVASVDYNYSVGEPQPLQSLPASGAPNFNLQAKPLGSGNPVVVGLIDTGFDPNNYCGLGSFMKPAINVAGNSAAAGATPGHGAAMAQTILHSLNTITKTTSVRILPVDVYGANANTTTFHVANGIYLAVNAGANIINLSLAGNGNSAFLHSVITTAHSQGVIFFGAAGNEPVTTPMYPAAYPEVVAVTAGSQNGTVANYANHGSFVDVVAPGGSVICYQGSKWLVNGTSAAAAYASGLAAGIAESSQQGMTQVQAAVVGSLPQPSSQP